MYTKGTVNIYGANDYNGSNGSNGQVGISTRLYGLAGSKGIYGGKGE